MKLKGDYTLILEPKEGETGQKWHKITAIEIKKEAAGFSGKPIKRYAIKTKSAHGDFYNLHIGMMYRFTLQNNDTGEKTRYEIGKRPYSVA